MWTKGKAAPQHFLSGHGTAVAHGNTAYFSHENNVYSFKVASNKWSKLPPNQNRYFSMAVINDKLTTIGGFDGSEVTNILLTLLPGHWWRKNWKCPPSDANWADETSYCRCLRE